MYHQLFLVRTRLGLAVGTAERYVILCVNDTRAKTVLQQLRSALSFDAHSNIVWIQLLFFQKLHAPVCHDKSISNIVTVILEALLAFIGSAF